MKYTFGLLVITIIVNFFPPASAAAADKRNINLDLRTVIEFDGDNANNDMNMIGNFQNLLNQVKNAISKKGFRQRAVEEKELKFSEFMVNAIDILLRYNDRDLEDVFGIISHEVKRIHHQDKDFRRITAKLDAHVMDAEALKKSLVLASAIISNSHRDPKIARVMKFLNSIYKKNAHDNFTPILRRLEQYRTTKRRNNMDLVEVIRSGLRDILFNRIQDMSLISRTNLKSNLVSLRDRILVIKNNLNAHRWSLQKKVAEVKDVHSAELVNKGKEASHSGDSDHTIPTEIKISKFDESNTDKDEVRIGARSDESGDRGKTKEVGNNNESGDGVKTKEVGDNNESGDKHSKEIKEVSGSVERLSTQGLFIDESKKKKPEKKRKDTIVRQAKEIIDVSAEKGKDSDLDIKPKQEETTTTGTTFKSLDHRVDPTQTVLVGKKYQKHGLGPETMDFYINPTYYTKKQNKLSTPSEEKVENVERSNQKYKISTIAKKYTKSFDSDASSDEVNDYSREKIIIKAGLKTGASNKPISTVVLKQGDYKVNNDEKIMVTTPAGTESKEVNNIETTQKSYEVVEATVRNDHSLDGKHDSEKKKQESKEKTNNNEKHDDIDDKNYDFDSKHDDVHSDETVRFKIIENQTKEPKTNNELESTPETMLRVNERKEKVKKSKRTHKKSKRITSSSENKHRKHKSTYQRHKKEHKKIHKLTTEPIVSYYSVEKKRTSAKRVLKSGSHKSKKNSKTRHRHVDKEIFLTEKDFVINVDTSKTNDMLRSKKVKQRHHKRKHPRNSRREFHFPSSGSSSEGLLIELLPERRHVQAETQDKEQPTSVTEMHDPQTISTKTEKEDQVISEQKEKHDIESTTKVTEAEDTEKRTTQSEMQEQDTNNQKGVEDLERITEKEMQDHEITEKSSKQIEPQGIEEGKTQGIEMRSRDKEIEMEDVENTSNRTGADDIENTTKVKETEREDVEKTSNQTGTGDIEMRSIDKETGIESVAKTSNQTETGDIEMTTKDKETEIEDVEKTSDHTEADDIENTTKVKETETEDVKKTSSQTGTENIEMTTKAKETEKEDVEKISNQTRTEDIDMRSRNKETEIEDVKKTSNQTGTEDIKIRRKHSKPDTDDYEQELKQLESQIKEVKRKVSLKKKGGKLSEKSGRHSKKKSHQLSTEIPTTPKIITLPPEIASTTAVITVKNPTTESTVGTTMSTSVDIPSTTTATPSVKTKLTTTRVTLRRVYNSKKTAATLRIVTKAETPEERSTTKEFESVATQTKSIKEVTQKPVMRNGDKPLMDVTMSAYLSNTTMFPDDNTEMNNEIIKDAPFSKDRNPAIVSRNDHLDIMMNETDGSLANLF